MNRSLKIIHEIPSNAVGIKLFADALVDGLMDGDVDPLDVRAKIDAIEKIIKAVKADDRFRDAVLDQADLHGDKTFELNGVKFTKADVVKYDYTADPLWIHHKAGEIASSQQRKDREAILKALKESTKIDGVICHPPVKSSTTGVRVTF